MKETPLLSVKGLRLDIPTAAGTLRALRGVDLEVQRGRTLGIVGESGSGKSLTALSILGLHPAGSMRKAEHILLDGTDIGTFNEARLCREVRGKSIGMIFQEPMTSLNPVMPIGRQLTEVMTIHGLSSHEEARERAVMLLERVGITGAPRRLDQYPHQFSGGQRQRVMIAMALMAKPRLLIADEPTTALDVTVQAEILRLLAELRHEFGMGLILITHNLGVVSRIADDVLVMYAGEVVETAPAQQLFRTPHHPYTLGLLASVPRRDPDMRGSRLGAIPGVVPSLIGEIRGCAFAPRCRFARDECRNEAPPVRQHCTGTLFRCIHDQLPVVEAVVPPLAQRQEPERRKEPVLQATGLKRDYWVRRGIFAAPSRLSAVAGVDLAVRHGEVLAIVGESGCGKSTLGRLLLGLEKPDAGTVLLKGRTIADVPGRERARLIQPIFQDPRGSLNPRRSVLQIIRRPLDVHGIGDPASRDEAVRQLMQQVGLPIRLIHAYPNQLSGGQRQRVAIARALIMKPAILLCDEPTSALDVSVQAQILNLLMDLKQDLGLTFVLITHDLSVVEHMADRVAVMYLGQIIEEGAAEEICNAPRHPYTRALIDSALHIEPGSGVPKARIGAGFPNPLNVPKGCPFAQRCPEALPLCADVKPNKHKRFGSGFVACHLFEDAVVNAEADALITG